MEGLAGPSFAFPINDLSYANAVATGVSCSLCRHNGLLIEMEHWVVCGHWQEANPTPSQYPLRYPFMLELCQAER